jgi:hypothetical protein
MCVYFYCLKYQVVFLLAFTVTAKNLIKVFFILTSNRKFFLGFTLFYIRVNLRFFAVQIKRKKILINTHTQRTVRVFRQVPGKENCLKKAPKHIAR